MTVIILYMYAYIFFDLPLKGDDTSFKTVYGLDRKARRSQITADNEIVSRAKLAQIIHARTYIIAFIYFCKLRVTTLWGIKNTPKYIDRNS